MGTPAATPETPIYVRPARRLTAALCYLFAAGVALQVFAIGMILLLGVSAYLPL